MNTSVDHDYVGDRKYTGLYLMDMSTCLCMCSMWRVYDLVLGNYDDLIQCSGISLTPLPLCVTNSTTQSLSLLLSLSPASSLSPSVGKLPRYDTGYYQPQQSIPVNSVDIEAGHLVCGTDGEAIFVYPNCVSW